MHIKNLEFFDMIFPIYRHSILVIAFLRLFKKKQLMTTIQTTPQKMQYNIYLKKEQRNAAHGLSKKS